MKRKYDDVPEADVVVNYVKGRYKIKGLNTSIGIIGLSGTGKSSVTMRLGELIIASRPEEKLKFIMVTSLYNLIKAIRSSKPGDIIGVDEVSVLFNSRRSMSKDNVAISNIFDTVRKKRLCIIVNLPIWKTLDSNVRSMLHVRIQTQTVNKNENVVVSRFHRLQTNPGSAKTYTHTMTRNGKDIHIMITRMPNKEEWFSYESQKDKFMDDLYAKLEKDQLKRKDIPKPKLQAMTEKELKVHRLVNIQGKTQTEVSKILGLSQQRISSIVKNIVKKSQLTKEKWVTTP